MNPGETPCGMSQRMRRRPSVEGFTCRDADFARLCADVAAGGMRPDDNRLPARPGPLKATDVLDLTSEGDRRTSRVARGRAALAGGKVVLADRFSLSTMAYQGYGRGLDLDEVRQAISIATGGMTPDLYIVLDLPADEGEKRQEDDGAPPDRIEAAGRSFRDTVRDAYLALAMSEPGVEVVSARGTPEDVHSRVRSRLAARFPAIFPDAAVTEAGRPG